MIILTFKKKIRFKLLVLAVIILMISIIPLDTLADNESVKYKLARIFSTDVQNGSVRAEILLELPFPDISLVNPENLGNIESIGMGEILKINNDCLIYIDSVQKTLSDIKPETFMLLTVENNLVTKMENISGNLFQQGGIYSGILEENNPALGYITLYFPDGSGISPNLKSALSSYRTYSYISVNDIIVYKNGVLTNIEALNPGDSVFIKLNDEGNIIKISGTDNFYPVYGKVRTKGNWILQIEEADRSIVQLRITVNVPIFQNRRRVSWSDIKEGDEVRVLLQTSGNQTIIGEITIENKEIEANGIYKANLTYYNNFTKSLVVSGMQQFKDGIWNVSDYHGIRKLTINDNYNPDIPKGAYGTVYLATGESITGNDTVVQLFLEDSGLRTDIIGDTIVEADPSRGRLILMNRNIPVRYDDTSLIIKKGKLLAPNQVNSRDEAYFVTSNLIDGTLKANVIWIQEPLDDTGLTLIRGRISQIDLYNSMTLESFSEFSEPQWEYYNVQKTLTIDPLVTRIFDDDGRIDLANFDDTAADNYKNQTVYVLAQDGKAMLVSTAPFGDVIYKGRIFELTGIRKDSFNHIVVPATSLVVKDGSRYNSEVSMWEIEPEVEFSFAPNTVFIKNGNVTDASQLQEGDRITIIKSEFGDNAFVILAESF